MNYFVSARIKSAACINNVLERSNFQGNENDKGDQELVRGNTIIIIQFSTQSSQPLKVKYLGINKKDINRGCLHLETILNFKRYSEISMIYKKKLTK